MNGCTGRRRKSEEKDGETSVYGEREVYSKTLET